MCALFKEDFFNEIYANIKEDNLPRKENGQFLPRFKKLNIFARKQMNNQNVTTSPCCPKFDPTLWDEKTHLWDQKIFIKDSIPQIFHVPLPWMINRMIGRMWKKAQDANAAPDVKDFLLLAYDPSPWKAEYYMAVNAEIPGTETVKLSGTYCSKVFDGPYHAVPKWMKEMDSYVNAQGKTVKKQFFYYTTCPKCAKVYGHNYVVAFAQLE